jgi:hypothetical protein
MKHVGSTLTYIGNCEPNVVPEDGGSICLRNVYRLLPDFLDRYTLVLFRSKIRGVGHLSN